MRYQISYHGWRFGDRVVPVGTVIDLPPKAGDEWSALALGQRIPPNAQPLDAEAWYEMARVYPMITLAPPMSNMRRAS